MNNIDDYFSMLILYEIISHYDVYDQNRSSNLICPFDNQIINLELSSQVQALTSSQEPMT